VIRVSRVIRVVRDIRVTGTIRIVEKIRVIGARRVAEAIRAMSFDKVTKVNEITGFSRFTSASSVTRAIKVVKVTFRRLLVLITRDCHSRTRRLHISERSGHNWSKLITIIYSCIYVSPSLCMCICMYACMYVRMHVCMYLFLSFSSYAVCLYA
jgi:hypothetical protein